MEKLTRRIHDTATSITAVPGPFRMRTSTQGFIGLRYRGTSNICHVVTMRVFVAENSVDTRPSPTLRARGSASSVWS